MVADGEIPRDFSAHWDATKTSLAGMWAQKRRLADAMRLVIERLVPSNAPVDELRAAADGLERAGDWRLMGYNSPMVPAGKTNSEVVVDPSQQDR